MSQPEPEAADQVLQWITLLQGNVDEYGGQLDLSDFDIFQADLEQIAGVLRNDPAQAAESQTNLIELVSRYPAVGEWLVGMDPAYRDLPGVNEPMAVEPAADAEQPEPVPTDLASQPAPAAQPTVPVAQPTVPAVQPPVVAQVPPAAAPVEEKAKEVPVQAAPVQAVPVQEPVQQEKAAPAPVARVTARTWTPDVVTQVGKEIVTAIIALTIIGSTVALVARSFGLIGDSSHISQAKDLLSIMLGLAGTVIGYYFGRVPADARATAATVRADQATAEKEQVRAQAKGLADDLDGIMSPTSMTELTRGEVTTHQVKLQKLRDGLRNISSS